MKKDHKNLFKRFALFCRKAFYKSESNLFIVINDFIAVVIVVSIISIILESVDRFSEYQSIFLTIEYVSLVIFSIEYICRIVGSKKKASYIFSFFGLIDLVSVLPSIFQVANFIPLKSLRALRIIRFLRTIRLAKVVRFDHLKKHSKENRSEIIKLNLKIYFFTVAFSIVILGTFAYIFESGNPDFSNIPLSMFWVLESLLGGSISDVVPQTHMGVAIFMIARFISYVLLGFLIHIISNIVSHLLLGESTDDHNKKPLDTIR